VKYACIEANRGSFEVRLMCRVLSVARSAYYAWRQRGPGQRAVKRARLQIHVRIAFRKSRRRYGSPRLHQALRREGIVAGRRQVAEAMRTEGLRARPKRRYVVTTVSDGRAAPAPNHLARRFAVEQNPTPDRAWVGDITYVPTREGWLFLAVILDLSSRRVVGWSMKDTLEAKLVTDALTMALKHRHPAAGLLYHTDRGVQYTCAESQAILARHGLEPSMSGKGNAYDNAVSESWMSTFKAELVEESDWHTHAEARRDIFEYIETWYNTVRLHSSLGYKSPAEYEAQAARAPRAA
jgi:transposase InsO family protein